MLTRLLNITSRFVRAAHLVNCFRRNCESGEADLQLIPRRKSVFNLDFHIHSPPRICKGMPDLDRALLLPAASAAGCELVQPFGDSLEHELAVGIDVGIVHES